MFKPIWTFFVLFSMLLMQISCQNLQNKQTIQPTVQAKLVATKQVSSTPVINKAPLPDYKLTNDILFSYLLGELARQNKAYDKAYDNFYQLTTITHDPRIAKMALRVSLKTGDDLKIFNAIQIWSELEHKTINNLQIRAVVLLKVKKDTLATKSLLDLFKLINKDEQSMARVGITLSSLTDYSRITAILSKFNKLYPNNYWVNLYIAKFALQFSDYSQAENFVNKSLQANPKSETALLLKASIYKRMKLGDKELQVYESAINSADNSDKSALIRLEYVKLLLAKNQNSKAIEQLESIVRVNNSDHNILYSIGMLAMDIKEYDYARRYFTMLYKLKKHSSQGAFLLGVIAYKEEKNKLALNWFNKVENKKYKYESLLRMAIILSEQKKYQRAIILLDNFLATLSNPPVKATGSDKGDTLTKQGEKQLNLLRLKADILYQAKLYNQAYSSYTDALKLKPKNAELLYSRAMTAEKLDKIALSEKDLLSIIKDDPKNSTAFNALGFILTERTTRYNDARKYIEKALQITPNDMAILDSMGWVLYKMGRIQESLGFLKQAHAFGNNPEIAAHYGEALWAAGDRQKATTIWKSALVKNPEHIVLKTTINNFLKP